MDYQHTTTGMDLQLVFGNITLSDCSSHVAMLWWVSVSFVIPSSFWNQSIRQGLIFCCGLLHCLPEFRTTRREQPTETVLVSAVTYGKFEKAANNWSICVQAWRSLKARSQNPGIVRRNPRRRHYIASVNFRLQCMLTRRCEENKKEFNRWQTTRCSS